MRKSIAALLLIAMPDILTQKQASQEYGPAQPHARRSRQFSQEPTRFLMAWTASLTSGIAA